MISDKIIVALDTQDIDEFNYLINELHGSASFVKVGMELFYTFGPDVIKKLKEKEFKIFLDLKMHDIPNTVASAAKTLAKLDVDIINLHAAGGFEMMRRASAAYREIKEDGIMIAVTHLTSTSQDVLQNEIGIINSIDQAILGYARNSKECGIDGIVCSPLEVSHIKKELGDDFKCVTPGIRLKAIKNDDQVRITTPIDALKSGSDYLVIGRPITKADSPRNAFKSILEEIKFGINS